MTLQTDPEHSEASLAVAPHLCDDPAADDPEAFADLVLDTLGREDCESAAALMRELRPADQGILLKRTSRSERRQLLGLLTLDELSDILDEAPTDSAATITRELPAERAADVLDEVHAHHIADILQELPQGQADAIVAELDRPQDVVPLLQYSPDSAGGIMTPHFPHVHQDDTAAIALDALRLFGEDAGGFGWVCVLDTDRRLVGYVSIANLALARPLRSVGELAEQHDHRLVWVTPNDDQEEAERIMSRYTLSILPVVDEEQRVLGVIQAEEMMHIAEEEATEDMLRIASAPGERVLGSVGLSIRHRLPWLILNLGTVLVAAATVSMFESTIAAIAMLAAFLPVVAGQGGLAGTQTVTLVVRGMAIGEVPHHGGMRLLGKELLLGLFHGLVLALIVGALGYLWKGSVGLAFALAIAMVGNLLIAALTGAGVPLMLRKMGIDPAVSSAVFVTTFTDVFGFLIFLGTAALLIAWLG